MNPFRYHRPETPEEALALLHQHGDEAKLMAGGTALVIMLKQRLVMPDALISLDRLRALAEVKERGELHLGLADAPHAETRRLSWSGCLCWQRPTQVSTVRIRMYDRRRPWPTRPQPDPPVTLLALDARVSSACHGIRWVPGGPFSPPL